MSKRSDNPEDFESLRKKIIGLGERSVRKSYYPKLQEQLRELERFRALLDQSNDAVFLMKVPSGAFIDVNEAACRMLSYSREQLLSLSMNNITDASTVDRIQKLLNREQAGEDCCLVQDILFVKSNGQRFPVEISVRVVLFDGVLYAVAAARDVTERRKAEEALRTSEENYRSIFNAANDAIFVHDIETGEVISHNEKTREMYGRTLEEFRDFRNESLFTQQPGYTARDAAERIRRAAAGEPQLFEWLAKKKNGDLFWIEVNLKKAVIGGAPRVIAMVRDISERKQAELRLRESELNLRTVLDSVYDAVFLHNLDGTIIDVNRKMLDLYGVGREQALSSRIVEDFSAAENDFDRVPDLWNRAIAGEDQLFEWKAKRPADGSVFDVEVFLRRITLRHRPVILANVRDITERKKGEELKSRLSAIVQTAEDAIISEDLGGVITTWNRGAERIYGYSAQEITGKSFSLLIPPERSGELNDILGRISRGEHVEHYESERLRKDGSLFHVSFSASPIRSQTGRISGAAIIAHDITDRIRSQHALKLTQFSMDHAAISVYLVGRDARILYVNEQACSTLGYEREELMQLAVYDFDPDFPRSRWVSHWQELKQKGVLRFETGHRRKDGTLVAMEISANYLAYSGQEFNVAFGTDITARKQSEQELARINRQKELILESAGDGIFGMNSTGHHTLVNSAGARMLGYRPDELMGRYSHSLWHHTRADGSPYPADECRIYRTRTDGISRHVDDEVFWKKDGTALPVEYVTTPIREGDAIVGSVVSFRDITERKRAEEALRISESRFRNLFKQSSISMQILSPEGQAIEVNQAFEELWGIRLPQLKDYNVLLDEQLIAKGIMPYIEKGFAGEAVEIPVVKYDAVESVHAGHARWVKSFMYPVKTGDGRVHQVVLMHWDVTDMKEAEESLRESEERFRAFFELAAVGAVEADPMTGRYLRVNDRFCRFTGYPRGVLLTMTISELTHPDDRNMDSAFFEQIKAGTLKEYSAEKRYIHKEGHTIWGHVFVTVIRDSRGMPVRTAAIVQDITSRKQAEEALRRSEEFLRRVLDNLIAFVAVLDSGGVLLEVNRSALQAAGLFPEDVLGKRFEDTYWFSWSTEAQARVRKAIEQAAAGEVSRFDMEARIAEGALMPIDFMLAPIRDELGRITHLIPSAIDITDRKSMENEIRHLAHHDTLTGLPNRRLFNEIAGVELAQARRNKKKFAVLFLDLDRFKEINDTLGHEAGDRLLREVAYRLKSVLRRSDSIGRIGGDEFNIILSDLSRPDDLPDIARKLVETVRKPLVLGGHELRVTASIGISIYPDDGLDQDTLFRYADMAMYHAKEIGRNIFQFYDPSINSRSIERMRLENMLRRSVELGEMEVYYQPLIDIASGKILCAEALLRWKHPERGLLAPRDFIPAAEETGFIAELDEWVLGQVSRQIRAWIDAGLPLLCVTVNLSARQFQSPDLLAKIDAILKETGTPPECLDIEIPESTAMRDVERTAGLMRSLAGRGVHISIDDFGTGYSSLNYLKRMPIEKLKIDRSFIMDITSDHDDRAIIQAVIAMAHSMKMKVIAEGVESSEQLSFLKGISCDQAQGFLFSGPVTADGFRELLMRR